MRVLLTLICVSTMAFGRRLRSTSSAVYATRTGPMLAMPALCMIDATTSIQ